MLRVKMGKKQTKKESRDHMSSNNVDKFNGYLNKKRKDYHISELEIIEKGQSI